VIRTVVQVIRTVVQVIRTVVLVIRIVIICSFRLVKWLTFILFAIVLASCSKMGIEKRRYQAGYYHENSTKEKVADRNLTAKPDKKTVTVKNTPIYKDTNIAGIVLPLKNTAYSKDSNIITPFVSTLKNKADYIISPYKNFQKAINNYKIKKSISQKVRDLGRSNNTWGGVLLLTLWIGLSFLIGLGLHALFPTLMFYYAFWLGFGILLIIILIILMIILLSK